MPEMHEKGSSVQDLPGLGGKRWWFVVSRTWGRLGGPGTKRRVLRMLGWGILLAGVVVSRIWFMPSSAWDQDEAYFASAVVRFDPTANRPHPPWFPGWIVLGRLVTRATGWGPLRSLQAINVLSSVVTVWVLAGLWGLALDSRTAVLAAVLHAFLPGSWLFGSRAFTEPTAICLMSAAVWLWWSRLGTSPMGRLAGSLLAGLACLVRPHLVLVLMAVLAVSPWNSEGPRGRVALERLLPGAVLGAAAAWWLVGTAGGLHPLLEALRTHARYHFGSLPDADLAFGRSCLSRALLSPVAAAAWILLSGIGTISMARSGAEHRAFVRRVWIGLMLPASVLAFVLADPEHTRYALPLLAWTSGFVVAGMFRCGKHAGSAALGLVFLASVLVTAHGGRAYRRIPSPPVRAIARAAEAARATGGVVVFDRRLVAFVESMRGRAGVPFWGSHLLELHLRTPPPALRTVAVFLPGWDQRVAFAARSETFSEGSWLVHRLEGDRFLDVTVAVRAALVPDGRTAGRWGSAVSR